MEEESRETARDCPCLTPAMSDFMWVHPTALYCRLPSGKIRVPSSDTLAWVCTNGYYHSCPNYMSFAKQGDAPSPVSPARPE
jgi:hypothetical protein